MSRIEFLPKLLTYFALSPKNNVEISNKNFTFVYYQDDNGDFHRIVKSLNDKEQDAIDINIQTIDLDTLYFIISYLPQLPCNQYKFTNMEEQVRFMSMWFMVDNYDFKNDILN